MLNCYCFLVLFLLNFFVANGQSYHLSNLKHQDLYLHANSRKILFFLKSTSEYSEWHLEFITENESDYRALIVHDKTNVVLECNSGICFLSNADHENESQFWIVKEIGKEDIFSIQHHQSKKILSFFGKELVLTDQMLENSKWKLSQSQIPKIMEPK